MTEGKASRNRGSRAPRPLDRVSLEALALPYVARFATSAAKLERYLVRKLRERGWEGDGEADPGGIVRRFAELGYVDDAAYARSKGGSLLRRGYGPRRIRQALAEAGIDEEIRAATRASEGQERRAALAMARKRGFGPFGKARPDRPLREKQLAAMLRAGHSLDSAREMVDAPSVDAAEAWAVACEDEDD